MKKTKNTLNLKTELARANAVLAKEYPTWDSQMTVSFQTGWLVSALASQLRDMGQTDLAYKVQTLTTTATR